MENKGNRFAWIVIGLGALALMFGFFGRGFGPRMGMAHWDRYGGPQAYERREQFNAPQGFEYRDRQESRREQFAEPHGSFDRGGRGFGHGHGPFGGGFFPFKIIGMLSRLALLFLLIMLGVQFLRRRNTGGSGPAQPSEPTQGPPQEPTDRPFTGETRSL